MITREMRDKSRHFAGAPRKDWELAGIEEGERCRVWYYRDGQGGYHHTAAPRRKPYDVYKIEIEERDGATVARVVNRKTGRLHPAHGS